MLIAHSNGAQIIRRWGRDRNGQADTWISLTTLHQGAPIVARALSGELILYPILLAFEGVEIFTIAADWEARVSGFPIRPGDVTALIEMIDFSDDLEARLERVGLLVGFGASTFAPALLDMRENSQNYDPDSPLHLNSRANLAFEAGSFPQRFNIRAAYRRPETGTPHNILFRTLYSEPQAEIMHEARFLAGRISLFLGDKYMMLDCFGWDYIGPEHLDSCLRTRESAWRFISLGMRLINMDAWWLEMVGVLGQWDFDQMLYNWADSDGVLPYDGTQVYPGAAVDRRILGLHTGVTQSPVVRDELRAILNVGLGIPFRRDVVAAVSVAPSSATVFVGQARSMTATVTSLANTTMSGSVQWSTDNSSVATVSTSGVVTGAGVGTTQVRATRSGLQGASTITVQAPPPAQLESVAISGPDQLNPWCEGTWTANPTSVNAGPFSYAWTIGGVDAGSTSAIITANASSSTFEVAVLVTQTSTGVQRSATLVVTVPDAMACVMEDE